MSPRYLFSFFLLLGTVAAHAQNTPDMSVTAPAGSASVIAQPPTLSVPNSTTPSYIRTYVPRVPITNAAGIGISSSPEEVGMSTVYKDGFNRTIQAVQHFATTGNKPHLVQPVDTRFRTEDVSFLPYPADNVAYDNMIFGRQAYYYANETYPGEGYTPYSIAKNLSDNQQRAVKSLAPGKSQVGQNRGVTVKKVTNGAGEVKIWEMGTNGRPVSLGTYEAGTLFGELAYDTSGAETVTYTDMDGRVVCRTVKQFNQSVGGGGGMVTIYGTTTYVYDIKGSLVGIMPPKATAASSTSVPQAVWDNLCFQYTYDTKGRKVEQKFPGKAVEYFVYDKRSRLVLYQDGEMRHTSTYRGQGIWRFYLYDRLDRQVVSGTCIQPETRAQMATLIEDTSSWPSNHWLHYMKNYDQDPGYPASLFDCDMETYSYYDNYSIADPGNTFWNDCQGALIFNNDLLSTPGNETPDRAAHQQGRLTGMKIKIMTAPGADAAKTGDWRLSVPYYDAKGRVIYTASKDLYQGSPIHAHYTGTQYDFAGRVLVSKHVMQNGNGHTQEHREWSFNEYDALTGKLKKTWHRVDTGAWNQQTVYSYDRLGRASRKVMGDYGEVQDYDYNIRGQLSGINAHYARTGDRQGESRSFGQQLCYDYGFTQPRYDGKLGGMIWRGAGNGEANAYGYSYDLSGRLTKAEFNRYEPPSGTFGYAWRNDLADYTTENISYDRDGNIEKMDQQGVKPGTGIVTMDKLRYTYENNGLSDRILKVVDSANVYDLGDFINPNGNNDDYGYNHNGSVSTDHNKQLDVVRYNSLGRPEVLELTGNRKIIYSYDATGNKVQELIVQNGHADKRTDYIGNYIYQNDTLQYLQTGEGRAVYSPNDGKFKEEYFVKDQLGNVRSVVEVYVPPVAEYLATHEVASANLEGLFFENIDAVRDDKPGGTMGDAYAASLNGAHANRRIGTSMLLHVMAGDKVEMNVNNFYERYEAENDQPVNMEDMLGSLIGTLTGGQGGYTGTEGHETKTVTDALTLENYSQFNDILNNTTDPNQPKAYLNYILFDEAFNIVPQMSGSFQANGAGGWTPIGTSVPLEVPASGYLAVYLSNSSTNASVDEFGNVYFDQLVIRFSRGKLKEEAHYYPHGLPINGMGSVAVGMIENKDKYQANAYNKELGLNWMDFNFRQYDPQIGRFLSVDPLADQTHNFSPYAAMNNNPASLTDPDGLKVGDHRQMAWSNPFNQFFWDGHIADAELFMNTNHIAEFISQSPWASGAGENVTTLYGENAQEFFANLTGQSLPRKEKIGTVAWGEFMPGTYEDYLKYEADQAYSNALMATNLPPDRSGPNTPENIAYWKKNTEFWYNINPLTHLFNDVSKILTGKNLAGDDMGPPNALASVGPPVGRVGGGAVKAVGQAEKGVFIVTKEGVVLPKGATIPSKFVENPHRSSSYGVMENGKFVEKLRIDPATPPGMKGPNFSHYHLNGSSKHSTGNWLWWID